jgi:AbrB family looped-hinge helix DNA binding protein
MPNLTITAKGQITLRKDLLRHLGLNPGDQVDIDQLPDGRIEIKAARRKGKISDVFGMLRQENGPVLTIDEINEATAKGWAGEP